MIIVIAGTSQVDPAIIIFILIIDKVFIRNMKENSA